MTRYRERREYREQLTIRFNKAMVLINIALVTLLVLGFVASGSAGSLGNCAQTLAGHLIGAPLSPSGCGGAVARGMSICAASQIAMVEYVEHFSENYCRLSRCI